MACRRRKLRKLNEGSMKEILLQPQPLNTAWAIHQTFKSLACVCQHLAVLKQVQVLLSEQGLKHHGSARRYSQKTSRSRSNLTALHYRRGEAY